MKAMTASPKRKLKIIKLKKQSKSVTALKKKADKYWSQYVRLRDSNDEGVAECITCGVSKHWKQLQCGHFVSRRVNLLRYDEENTNAQCMGCNVMKHGDIYTYGKNLDLKYGDGTADKLHAQRFTSHKFTVDELEQIIHDAQEMVKFYINQL